MKNDVAFSMISSDVAAERSLRCFIKTCFSHENERKHPFQGKGYSSQTLSSKNYFLPEKVSLQKKTA